MQSPETNTTLKPTRASFIRSVPITMPIEEVIERAREAGLELQESDIHAQRYYMRQGSTGAPAPKRTIVQPRMRDNASEANGTANGTRESSESKESREPQQKVIESFFTVRSVDASGNTAPARATRETRDSEASPTPARKTRTKRYLSPQTTTTTTASSVDPEEQLRQLIVRLGSARAREIIDETEALALSVSDDD